jgi:hypothetical protein
MTRFARAIPRDEGHRVTGNFLPRPRSSNGQVQQEHHMGRGLLLWLIGIPIPIILLIWLFGGLH